MRNGAVEVEDKIHHYDYKFVLHCSYIRYSRATPTFRIVGETRNQADKNAAETDTSQTARTSSF